MLVSTETRYLSEPTNRSPHHVVCTDALYVQVSAGLLIPCSAVNPYGLSVLIDWTMHDAARRLAKSRFPALRVARKSQAIMTHKVLFSECAEPKNEDVRATRVANVHVSEPRDLSYMRASHPLYS